MKPGRQGLGLNKILELTGRGTEIAPQASPKRPHFSNICHSRQPRIRGVAQAISLAAPLTKGLRCWILVDPGGFNGFRAVLVGSVTVAHCGGEVGGMVEGLITRCCTPLYSATPHCSLTVDR